MLAQMERRGLDVLCVYADREHGGNFGYLTGFEPRFEEALLVLHRTGKAFLLLGNESLRMGAYSRLENTVIHVPHFSLPNQPMEPQVPFAQLLADAGLCPGMHAGIAGWKMFTSEKEDNAQLYDVPHFIVEAIKNQVESCVSCGGLFIHCEHGVRVVNNANEIAHFEYGAALASDCVMTALHRAAVGSTELEVADALAIHGQPVTVQTICAAGERFTDGEVAPRNKKLALGDTFSVTMGLRGGLTSRAGYIAASKQDLPENVRDYMDVVAKPYFAAAVMWLETIGLGVTGDTLYSAVNGVIPREDFGWTLNPGHLTASEEWLSSPIAPGSPVAIKSGMLFQLDILPRRPGYGGANAEDGVAIADAQLRQELAAKYPQVWQRMQRRREYLIQVLGIRLKPEVLPMSDTVGYLQPYILDPSMALYVKR